ncbi:MAG: glutamate-1-semialdehyde 2,1-aminomutase [Candidatus Eremiobacteraeota bacterium]|nr:glutamate-1-semialdehyde 2,1-aminomutase [Candidatus Eremiobacteraeota bacterium]
MTHSADDTAAASRGTALAGGVSSPVRSGAAVGGAPFVQVAGRGAYAYDRNGRAYVDYVMAYGPLLFGHAHPALVRGLDELAAHGTVFGSTCAAELRLAQRIAAHVPSMQALRFVSTGTEAMMSAVRVARAYTRRPLIVRFAGNYHGHFDAALEQAGAGAPTQGDAGGGIPPSGRAEVVVARYNDLADLDAKVGGRGAQLAAIALEPMPANMGLVSPAPGFIDGVFARARAAGALVIFDEVITWLRVGLGGEQGRRGYSPDLTALGKIAGGGLPLAAFGGRADVMAVLAPGGFTFTGGTFSGNPLCVGLAHRVLDLLESDCRLYARLEARARELAAGIRAVFARRGMPYAVTQYASMVDFAFRPGAPARNDAERSQSNRAAFAAYYHAMRERGVLLAPSPNELMFLSSEHGDREIEFTLTALDATFEELQQRRLV